MQVNEKRTLFKDGNGYVELLDVMGSDSTIVDVARVSMHKEASQFTTEQNQGLINYLIRESHWSPLAHPQIRVRLLMPIFVARQWFKHSIGIVRNEESRRYVDYLPQVFTPDTWRSRAERVKQGSIDEPVHNHAMVQAAYEKSIKVSLDTYEFMLANDVAPELARIVLPQSCYVELIETISLQSMLRVIHLRTDSHAQKEIQLYAKVYESIVKEHFPMVWNALNPIVTQEVFKSRIDKLLFWRK
jgi:thymidylate synthase (FAD)